MWKPILFNIFLNDHFFSLLSSLIVNDIDFAGYDVDNTLYSAYANVDVVAERFKHIYMHIASIWYEVQEIQIKSKLEIDLLKVFSVKNYLWYWILS